MKTEKETTRFMLETAAKAAGYNVIGYVENYDNPYWQGPTWGLELEGWNGLWNPIEDNGDAFELAAILFITTSFDKLARHAIANKVNELYDDSMFGGDCDPERGMRKAITAAAAEMVNATGSEK